MISLTSTPESNLPTQDLLTTLSAVPERALDFETEDRYSMLGERWIYECACATHARNKNDSRKNLEEKILQTIQQHFENTDELNILSLGSEGCFQELVIHAKIVKRYNKKINWIVVDPIYKNSKNKTLEKFTNLIKQLSPNSTVSSVKDDQEALHQLRLKALPQPHLFLSIDSLLSKRFLVTQENQLKSILDAFRDSITQLNFPHIWAILEDPIPGRVP